MLAPDSLEFSHSSANLIMEELGCGLEGCLRTNGASQRVDSQNGNCSILLWAPLLLGYTNCSSYNYIRSRSRPSRLSDGISCLGTYVYPVLKQPQVNTLASISTERNRLLISTVLNAGHAGKSEFHCIGDG